MGVTLDLSLSYGCPRRGVPARASFQRWAMAALLAAGQRGRFELSLRVVDNDEGLALNRDFRGKAYATNVLSFPSSPEERVATGMLGDLVICAPVVALEAREQRKTLRAHWAHMVVHGMLHLLDYDHENARAARTMEALEVEILHGLGFHDPYAEVTEQAV